MVRMIRLAFAGVMVMAAVSGRAAGDVITFENFAPPGGLVNINPTAPYQEAGFRLTPSNGSSAVFDSANLNVLMPGNTTDFFGFAAGNDITLTNDAGRPFALTGLLIGRLSIAQVPSVDITLVGNLVGGGSLTRTFSGITTATLVTLTDFVNLSSVVLRSTSDSGIDNLNVTPVPEPSSLALCGVAGLAALGYRRFRRRASTPAV
jgi:hypothetical protein